jgi:hypothetical protein
MSRRYKDKGRIEGQFVPLLVSTLKCPAWRALSHGARSLYVALKSRYGFDFKNNGKIFLSTRDAAEELGSNREAVQRWFRELEFYGFIVKTAGGCLGVDGNGKAPRWRLTELGYMADPPTKDFLRWNGTKFADQFRSYKKQNPGREGGSSVDAKVGPPSDAKVGPVLSESGRESGSIYVVQGGRESGSISKSTILSSRNEHREEAA